MSCKVVCGCVDVVNGVVVAVQSQLQAMFAALQAVRERESGSWLIGKVQTKDRNGRLSVAEKHDEHKWCH